MIGLIQRASEASVAVDDRTIGQIGRGLLVLLGVEKHDDEASVNRLLERILTYRVFPDAELKGPWSNKFPALEQSQYPVCVDCCPWRMTAIRK